MFFKVTLVLVTHSDFARHHCRCLRLDAAGSIWVYNATKHTTKVVFGHLHDRLYTWHRSVSFICIYNLIKEKHFNADVNTHKTCCDQSSRWSKSSHLGCIVISCSPIVFSSSNKSSLIKMNDLCGEGFDWAAHELHWMNAMLRSNQHVYNWHAQWSLV